MKLPRTNPDGSRIGLLTACGGHGTNFHFHERLNCVNPLRDETSGHSLHVGQAFDGKAIYGSFEQQGQSPEAWPTLDACGGHFGRAPGLQGSGSSYRYHYHVSAAPPFTLGCYGPSAAFADGTTNGSAPAQLVTVDACRALYPSCGDGSPTRITAANGDARLYDLSCPCFDANGSNVRASNVRASADSGSASRTVSESGIKPSSILFGALGLSCILCQCCCFYICVRRKKKSQRAAMAAERVSSSQRIAPHSRRGRPAPSKRSRGAKTGQTAPTATVNSSTPLQDLVGGARPSRPAPLTKAGLEGRSLKELRGLAHERAIDLTGCVEKSDVVERLLGS